MGIIAYIICGLIAEYVVVRYLVSRTANAMANDPDIIFHYDNETTGEHESVRSTNVSSDDVIVKKTAKTGVADVISSQWKKYTWKLVIPNLVSLCLWPITMPLTLMFLHKCVTDEAIVNDILSDE